MHISVYVIVQEQKQQFTYSDFFLFFFLQRNNGVSWDTDWTSVLLPGVQIPTGIWWTSFT